MKSKKKSQFLQEGPSGEGEMLVDSTESKIIPDAAVCDGTPSSVLALPLKANTE